jgi:peptide/nickel transport system ATP-binding protein
LSELLTVEQLRIESHLGGRKHTIVSGVDLSVGAGETVGIVGESGSGKSLTARAILGLLPPGVTSSGSVRFKQRELTGGSESMFRRVRGRQLSLLFQDPYTLLNPLVRVGRQITETLDTRRGEAERRLAEVGISDLGVARRYPFQLSGGMRQRVGIAAALASDPELLIADEPSTALDVTTQKEILKLLRSIQEKRGMSLILITHDLRVAFSMCDRVYVFYAGSVLEVSPAAELEHRPLHPYSLALLVSEPPLDRRLARLATVEGAVPSPDDVTDRCPFAARCRWAEPECIATRPPLASVEGRRLTACIRIREIGPELASARVAAAEVAPPLPDPTDHLGDPIVRIRDLSKRFQTNQALSQASVDVYPGESVGLVGESGSGKSTLARCLVGLEHPSGGTVTVGGVDATDFKLLGEHDLRLVRRTVQIIFQDPYSSLNPARTVGATLSEALEISLEGGTINELLELVGLPAAYARRKPAALSGGERQRVAIARALAVRPRLLICDEPVSALDVSIQAQILNLFRELRSELGIAYLFITHDLAVVRQVAERVYVLYRGNIVEEGAVDAVLDEPGHEYTRRLVASVPTSQPDWLTT